MREGENEVGDVRLRRNGLSDGKKKWYVEAYGLFCL